MQRYILAVLATSLGFAGSAQAQRPYDGEHQTTQGLESTTTTRLRFGANWYP